MAQEEISATSKYLLLLAMIISGAANTIVYNTQNSSITTFKNPDTGKEEDYQFNHPFLQAMTMFIGEFSVITMFVFTKKLTADKREKWEKEKEEEAAPKGLSTSWKKFLWLIIPASSDFFTSTLQYIALNYINPSIYQMLRGGVILVTALFSKWFLKRTIYKHMILGCALVFIGIGLVGSSGFAFPEKSDGEDDGPSSTAQAIAMGLIILSLIFNGCLFVSEEFLFGKFLLHPFQVVGTEGFWGIVIYSTVLPILSTVTCPLGTLGDTCVVYPKDGPSGTTEIEDNQYNREHSHFESPALFFKQFASSFFLGFMVVLGVLTIAIFNVCGVNVTKHISALTRSIADVSRTLLVWIASIIITKTAGKTKANFQWENLQTGAILMEVAGFIILVVGNFIYNGIIQIPGLLPPTQEDNDSNDSQEKPLMENGISLQNQDDVEEDLQYDFEKKSQRAKRSMGRESFHN